MKYRPILFSGPMVRALLDGRKTQTRRVVKPQFAHDAVPCEMSATNERGHQISGHSGVWWCDAEGNHENAVRCPYGQPGDRLWVREAHAVDGTKVFFRAAHEESEGTGPRVDIRWRPSIHMPRWASRITLEVTGVRVERVQDISEADALKEGIRGINPYQGLSRAYASAYSGLWESLNGPGSWDANPWVWVVEFRRLEGGA